MNLLIVNPNTSDAMTEDIRRTVEQAKSPDVSVTVTGPDFGPEALESFYDYTLAAFGLCRLLEQKTEQYDGVLIACYGDPGLYAAKEICDCPVIGIAEASISVSLLLGSRFSILTASEKAVPMMENMVTQYGMQSRRAGEFPISMSVLDAEANRDEMVKRLIATGQRAVDAGAEVLILGCAGMTGFSGPVSRTLGVPVMDPVETASRTLEMMCRGNIGLSKKGLYKTPDKKNLKNEPMLTKNLFKENPL